VHEIVAFRKSGKVPALDGGSCCIAHWLCKHKESNEVISLMITVKPGSKNTVCVSSKLSWTCTFPLALKYEGYKIPYKCMKCPEIFP